MNNQKNQVAIVFPGQGSQIVGMGKDLFDNFKSARDVFEIVDENLGYKLSNIIFSGPNEELTKTENTQPALMAVSMAIIKVLENDFGKKFTDLCSITAGHSLGEYSALCASGSFDIANTAKLLKIRGQAMAKCGASDKSEGAMAAILGADIIDILKLIEEVKQDEVCQIANDNSTGQIVISGNKSAIIRAIEKAKDFGIKKAIMLPVSGAFHSQLMRDAEITMSEALSKIEVSNSKIPVIANISAQIVGNSSAIVESLVKQITGTVKWRETMLFMEQQGIKKIIEIGSGKVLAGLATRTCSSFSALSIQNIADIENFCNNH